MFVGKDNRGGMTTPIQPAANSIQIADTENLLAAVPHLLGFHPVDSLVVIGLQGNDPMTIGLTLRVDLPPPEQHDALAEQLAIPLTKHGTAGAVLLIVGGADGVDAAPPDDLPHRAMTTRLEVAFAQEGIPVVHRLWLPNTGHGARWSCYDDEDCGGSLPDPATTPLAAASVLAGAVTMSTREDLVAGLATADATALARRARLLDTASRNREPGSDGTIAVAMARLAAVRAAVRRSVAGPPTLDDNDVLTLSEALSDHRVRDACLIQDEGAAAAAEYLWTALTRATPPPERAEAACLLAFSAYLRGDGVLAGIALEQAEEADPGHRLTSLLRNSLLFGLPPNQLLAACVEAAQLAAQQLSEEKPS
jgi:hypothetical protein